MYSQSITRNHRTAFIIAIDGSGTMGEQILYKGTTTTKAKAVASITNEIISELVERARRSDGVRDYYDVAVIGYAGNNEIYSQLRCEGDLVSITKLAEPSVIDMQRCVVEKQLPEGSSVIHSTLTPTWVDPIAAGQTPMCEAFRHIRDMLTRWCAAPSNAESFPPIVFNITDGEATDCDDEELRYVANQIKSISTADGNVLLINIHLTNQVELKPIIFPSKDECSYAHRYAALLYDCSSELPELFNDSVRVIKGDKSALPPFQGVCVNASATELMNLLNIGSISAKIE